jgi:hypothetical protein
MTSRPDGPTTFQKSTHRCNVPHKPDLRTANYAPEFPLNVITIAAIFTVSTDAAVTASAAVTTVAAIFTVSTDAAVTAAAASIIAVTAAAVYTAGSIAIIPNSFRRRRLLHYRTADTVARRLQNHQFRRRCLCLRSSSTSGPPVQDEDLTSEGTASVMADKRRATSDRVKNDGNE